MKNIMIILLTLTFANTSFAFMGKSKGKKKGGECKKFVCKDMTAVDAKITCMNEKLMCQKGVHTKSLEKMKSKSGKKKFAKMKAKKIAKFSEKIAKTNERIAKITKNIEKLKNPETATKLIENRAKKGKPTYSVEDLMKLKEARLNNANERLKMFSDHKSQIEGMN